MRFRSTLFAVAMIISFAAMSQAAESKTEQASRTSLRAHIGVNVARGLLHSADPEERLRGVERAASSATPQAVWLLAQVATTSARATQSDPRALIALARALSRFTDYESARTALFAIVSNKHALDRSGETGDLLVEMARQIAALAIAQSGVDRALKQLYDVAKVVDAGQNAAILALLAAPPHNPEFFGNLHEPSLLPTPPTIVMLAKLGDKRAIEVLELLAGVGEISQQAEALVALAELGDKGAIALARAVATSREARLRSAAAEVFVILSDPERFKATVRLIEDDATVANGVRLAERVSSPDITKALAERAASHPAQSIRVSCIYALGRSPDPGAATVLATLATPTTDPELAYARALALARSPAPNAGALIVAMAKKPLHDEGALGLRAYIVRALASGDRNPPVDRMLSGLSRSADGQARAIGTFASIALFNASIESALGDSDARVRRAAIMGSFARPPSRSIERALLARWSTETDSITRQLLAVGLLGGDPDRVLTTRSLIDRAQSGGADMALAAYALARRANEPFERNVQALLTNRDPVLRAHTARGLGASKLPDASGRLATAYAYETDASVRRAIVAALVERTMDASSPSRKATLEMAARLDPDGPTRQTAQRALKHGPGTDRKGREGAPAVREVAWLHITNANGTRPDSTYVGSVVRGDGFAVPTAFDDDGFAIITGLLPGDSRLVLATRLPSSEGELR
ncbi:MAG: HEAT repeat domain-containing protein [Polyangiaceae bacterium]|nr:HEAT repeat domain-containing protein [Polyangiaceae bacterium]